MRRSIIVGSVLLLLSFVLVGGPGLLTSPTTSEVAPDTTEPDADPEIVRPTEGESGFWPYLNSRRAFEQRSPINVVVIGETDTVVRSLIDASDTDWEETDPEQQEADPGTYAISVDNTSETDESADDTTDTDETADDTTETTESADDTTETTESADDTAETTESADITTETTDSTDDDPSDTDGTVATTTETDETDDDHSDADETVNDTSETNESAVDDGIEVGATRITWSRTTGATRYTYVDPGDGEDGQWVEETAQIHDGTYYGSRYHIRMYESPNPEERWVAMQTHHEHFDWFTLRHRVDGSQAAQMRLEADLMALEGVHVREDVSREYLGNSNSRDADGWATVVDLAGTLATGLLLGIGMLTGVVGRTRREIDDRLTDTDRRRLAAARERVDRRHPLLAVLIVGVVLGVRVGGIALEGTGLLTMHAIAAVLYPFVGLGLPLGTYLLARRLERRLDAAVVASASLAVAIWLDYGVLGVTTLPIDVIVQRMLVVVALGLIAGGATRRATRDSGWNGLLLLGTALWVLLLAGTLIGYL